MGECLNFVNSVLQISDFGTCKRLSGLNSNASSFKGTFQYMAPVRKKIENSSKNRKFLKKSKIPQKINLENGQTFWTTPFVHFWWNFLLGFMFQEVIDAQSQRGYATPADIWSFGCTGTTFPPLRDKTSPRERNFVFILSFHSLWLFVLIFFLKKKMNFFWFFFQK